MLFVFLQMEIERADGARISHKISAKGNPQTPVPIELPDGEYAVSYSLYSAVKQVNGNPCSIRTASDFKDLTWEKALEWCNLTFQDLAGLPSPFVWLEGVQTAMYQTTQPVRQPRRSVVPYYIDRPLLVSLALGTYNVIQPVAI